MKKIIQFNKRTNLEVGNKPWAKRRLSILISCDSMLLTIVEVGNPFQIDVFVCVFCLQLEYWNGHKTKIECFDCAVWQTIDTQDPLIFFLFKLKHRQTKILLYHHHTDYFHFWKEQSSWITKWNISNYTNNQKPVIWQYWRQSPHGFVT